VRPVLPALGALALMALPAGAPPVQAAPPVYPQLSISLSPETMELNASYYDQEVTLEGTLTVDNPSGTDVDIYIRTLNSARWAVYCNPCTFTVRGSGSGTFVLTATVPARMCNRTVEVWVEGEARLNGVQAGTNLSQHAQIVIGPLAPAAAVVAAAGATGAVAWRWRRGRRAKMIKKDT